MKLPIGAALALLVAMPVDAQTTPPLADLGSFAPMSGNWSYAPAADGSEAMFSSATGYPQVWVHCTRATRQVSIRRSASSAASLMNIWTSSAARAVPSTFDAATARLTVDLPAYDPLLDAIANSRGRLGFAIGSGPEMVVPAWAEVARVIEDCRS